jgi:DNA-binding NarL/FixJ family response regulator
MPCIEAPFPVRLLIAGGHGLVDDGVDAILSGDPRVVVEHHARSGVEAVHVVERLATHVVLVMLGSTMEAVDTIRALVQVEPHPAVLAVSQVVEGANVLSLLQAGAMGCLTAAASANELVAGVVAVSRGESVLSASITSQVMSYFSAPHRPATAGARDVTLHDTDIALLRLAGSGLENRAVALALGVDVRVVQRQLAHIYEVLGVGSRTQAVVTALKQGWLELRDIP